MHSGDLYVGVGQKSRAGRCRVSLRWIGSDNEAKESFDSIRLPRVGADTATLAQTVEALVDCLRRFIAAPPAPSAGTFLQLLLDITPAELYAVDWEVELRRPDLPAWSVVRFIDRSDGSIGVAFELPARVLHTVDSGPPLRDASEAEQRYFRLHRLSRATESDVLRTLRGGRFEVAHLVVRGRWGEAGKGVLHLADRASNAGPGIDAAALAAGLHACRARLLVLEAHTPDGLAPLLDLAHRLQRRGGPTTLLLEAPTSNALEAMYMMLVHDESIDAAGRAAASAGARHVLFEGIGGASAMSLVALRDRTLARVRRANRALLSMASDRREPPTPFDEVQRGGVAVPPDDLAALVQRAASLMQRVYNPAHETGQWIPLGDDAREADALCDAVAKAAARNGRVVNVGLWPPGQPAGGAFGAMEPLRARQRCLLGVQIGPVAPWTLVRDGRPLPEMELARRSGGGELELRVVVFAPEFELDEDEATMRLPPPPGPSDLVTLGLTLPARPGAHRLRVGIYHKNNLLQSILVRLEVLPQAEDGGAATRRSARANATRAEVEYALSETLADPGLLPGRTVNILCNDGGDSTHTFAIVGSGFKQNLRFAEGRLRSAVNAARSALFDVAAERPTGKPPRYRFGADNSGPASQMAQDLIGLARRGHALFSALVTAEDRAFKARLLAALGPGGATIQVAATVSAQYVFPWAMVYDHPLVDGAQSLCPRFAAEWSAGTPLETATCFAAGCPHRGDTAVVCPSGFWGFKHLLEQPLSVVRAKKDADSDGAGTPTFGASDLVIKLAAGPAGTDVQALMAVSRELGDVAAHVKEMRGAAGWHLEVKDNKAEVLLHMQAAAAMRVPLIYFYCHGGRAGADAWLGIGRGERLLPGDLEARDIDWSAASPLVLINGCHTVDLTPDDLVSFNETLSWCGAAGAIGTEIDVPESLARDFARGFFAELAAGQPVGAAIRRRRFSLLARGNPLGLAYTPYCSASLQLDRQ